MGPERMQRSSAERERKPSLTGSTSSDSEDRAVFKVNWNKPVTSGASAFKNSCQLERFIYILIPR